MILIIFFLFCVISLIAILEDRLGEEVRTPLFFAVGLILVFVAGLRPSDLDHDYMSYVSLYYRKEAEFTTEISFVFIANFVYYVLGNVVFVFLIYAFLSLALHMKAIRRLTSLWFLSLLMYFCNYYLLHGMNQIRVGVSAGLFLCAIPYLKKGDRWHYLLLAFCASLFHYTSAILLLLVGFGYSPFKKWQYYFYLSIIPLCYLLYLSHTNLLMAIPIPYIEEKLTVYQNLQKMGQWDEINVFNMVFLAKIAITYFVFWKHKLIAQYNPYVTVLLKFEILSLAAFIIFYELPVLAFRLSELLGVVEVILFPLVFYTIKPSIISKVIVVFISLVFLCIGIFFNQVIYV